MRVRDEEHLFDLMELLEADDADFARAWCGFKDKAELLLVALAHNNHIRGHRHALD